MGNNSTSTDLISFREIEHQINSLVVELPEPKFTPNFSRILIEEKLKFFKRIYDIVLCQKKRFLQNYKEIMKKIDEQFQSVIILVLARERALINELAAEAKEKVGVWDQQICLCENVIEWLKRIDATNSETNRQGIRDILNTRLKEYCNYIDSSYIEFEFGEETINNSTISPILKPLKNLGKIISSRDLKLIVPKVIIGSSGNGDGQFCRPWGVCTDAMGNIFISDRSNNRIQIFNELGEFLFQFGKEGSQVGEFNRPAGITVNKKNEIIVADKDNHRIQILTYSGRVVTVFGSQGTQVGQFFYPWGVAVNNNLEIAVSDSKNHRVQLFTGSGYFLNYFDWRKRSVARPRGWLRFLDSPRGLAFRPDGSLLVTDFNIHRILIINKNFNQFKTFGCEGNEEGKFFRPQGIACDKFGKFAVADSKNFRVQVFDAKNCLIKTFGFKGSDPGQFDGPQGVAFHPNGSIVVVDFNNNRVQVF